MTYRAAVVGCGRIGSGLAFDPLLAGDVMTHSEAYARCPDTVLVAVADTNREAAEACAKSWKVESVFSSAAELGEVARPEIVSVCTPTATHSAVLGEILRSNHVPKAIICEKPIAGSVADAERLVALARERDVLFVVVHMRRYARNMQRLREFLAAGEIGELRGVSGWLTKGTVHNGTHWFDLLRFLVGEVKTVAAIDSLHEGGADPTLDVMLGLANGMTATMRAADAGNFALCEMDILGTSGRVRIVDSSYVVELSRAVASPRYSGYVELVKDDEDFGSRRDVMLHAVEDVVRCLRDGGVPLSTGEDGIAALRIGLAAHESARTGSNITL